MGSGKDGKWEGWEVGRMGSGGWEVGLHGGHETYNNPAEIKSEEQKLEAVLSHLLAL